MESGGTETGTCDRCDRGRGSTVLIANVGHRPCRSSHPPSVLLLHCAHQHQRVIASSACHYNVARNESVNRHITAGGAGTAHCHIVSVFRNCHHGKRRRRRRRRRHNEGQADVACVGCCAWADVEHAQGAETRRLLPRRWRWMGGLLGWKRRGPRRAPRRSECRIAWRPGALRPTRRGQTERARTVALHRKGIAA